MIYSPLYPSFSCAIRLFSKDSQTQPIRYAEVGLNTLLPDTYRSATTLHCRIL